MINFSHPYSPENYFHRVGRTARFGNYGVSFLLMDFGNRIEFLSQKEYKFKIKKFEKKYLDKINEKLLKKKNEREENKTNEKKNIYDIGSQGILPKWMSAEVEIYDNSKFNFYKEKKEENSQKSSKTKTNKTKIENEKDLEFESEMLEMEIKRLEKEERDLLGLREGEELAEIHNDENIEKDKDVFIGKREQMEYDYEQPQADFKTFSKLFNFLECSKCIENIDQIEELFNRKGEVTIFKKLIDDIFN